MNIPGRFSQSSGDLFNGKLKIKNGKWKIIRAARADLNSHRGLDPRSAAEKYG